MSTLVNIARQLSCVCIFFGLVIKYRCRAIGTCLFISSLHTDIFLFIGLDWVLVSNVVFWNQLYLFLGKRDWVSSNQGKGKDQRLPLDLSRSRSKELTLAPFRSCDLHSLRCAMHINRCKVC